jgi:hypothetical protein
MEQPRQFDIVESASRTVAQLCKLEPDHIVADPKRAKLAPEDLDGSLVR